MNKEKFLEYVEYIIWDYNIDPNLLYEVFIGKRDKIAHFDRNKIIIRILENLPWYDVIEIISVDEIKNFLTPENIRKIYPPAMREKYDRLRKILLGEPLPSSGWDNKDNEKFRYPFLSNRWYRFK